MGKNENKKSFCPHITMGQKLTTSAVPPRLPLKKRPLTAHNHVRLFDNGGGTPSAPTAPHGRFRLPSRVHSTGCPTPQFHRLRLSEEGTNPMYFSRSQVFLIRAYCTPHFRCLSSRGKRKVWKNGLTLCGPAYHMRGEEDRPCFVKQYKKRLIVSVNVPKNRFECGTT